MNRNMLKTVLVASAACFTMGALGAAGTIAYSTRNVDSEIPVTSAVRTAPQEGGNFMRVAATQSFDTDFTVAAESTINSVVCIKNFASPRSSSSPYGGGGYDPFGLFDFFFGPQQPQQQQPRNQQRSNSRKDQVQRGLGSGVIISADGYIVTNNHVIDGADRLEVLLNDNSTYDARVIGTDEATDLALIKIDADGLNAITLGDSDALKVGEWVLAVGNPFGFNSTVTAGIVSAKARSLSHNSRGGQMGIESFIQTDAALNPGNSGGALVNLKGELIGINSAIYSNTGSYSGFSFAIPTTIVEKVILDLRQYGTVQRALLGCTGTELTSEIAKEKGITATKTGFVVMEVTDRSTAKELGLKADDVIVAINNVNVATHSQLVEQLNRYRPGDKITVTFYRDNERYTKSATLRNNHGSTELTKKGDFASLGCAFKKLSEDTRNHLGISYGVQVTGLSEGLLSQNRVKEGFIITEVNNQPVSSSDDIEEIYNKIMKSSESDKLMVLKGLYPTGKRAYYAIDLEEQ